MIDPAARLLDAWEGPYGGLPPFDCATPELIERATHIAIDRKRAEIMAIAANPAPPTFENTLEAVEDSGRALRRAACLREAFFQTRAVGAMPEVNARLAPLLAALEDEIAHHDILFARINAVYDNRAGLGPDQARLTEVIHERMLRAGAALSAEARKKLTEINSRIAAVQSRFHENMIADAASRAVFVSDEAELDGLPEPMREMASRLAGERGRPGEWAIANTRTAVWPTLQMARNRELRRRVRDMWMTRCAVDGQNDNRSLIAEIVRLRGEKARLLGFPTFAHWATAGRMARTPEAAMELLLRTWGPVRRETLRRQEELQALARADGIVDPIEAHDWLYYAEQYRKLHFGLDANAVKPYLEYRNVLNAILHAASRLHGLYFRELHDVPTIHPEIRVYEASCSGEPIGVIWFDLLYREGKMRGSWQLELRAAETFRGRVISYSNVCANLERQRPDGPVLMGWEYANVLFHEFGHALHMIMSRARYPSLGSMGVSWDIVELPAQLNERWLYDRELLRKYARHYETGEPMPDDMIEAIEAAARFERVFSVSVEYLMPAIVDMRLYLAADGGEVDPLAIERAAYAELGMPEAVDAIFRLPHQYHSFTDVYAAGIYVYLWADVMVADVLAAFLESPGGLYDPDVSSRWRDHILSVGHGVPGELAFRQFRGRDPDQTALLRRFALA